MKRLVVVLGGLLALPAFAEVAPFYYYDDAIEYSDAEYADDGMIVYDDEVADDDAVVVQQPVAKVNPRVTTATRNGSRSGTTTTNVNAKRASGTNTRVVAARTTTSRTAATPARTTVSRGTVSRAGTTNNTTTPGVSARRATNNTNASVARAGATMTSNGTTTSVFEDNNLYTGRVGVRGYANRVPTIRVASATVTTGTTSVSSTTNVADTTDEMDKLAELTDYCKAQYTACMDNFCNVLDDNQGRCSCSKNLKNYEKTEQALKEATEELQDVAQKIQYIGLTGDEITTLFSETEAEEAMRGKNDNSQIKANLDKVRDMIIDVRSGSTSVSDSSMSFDLSNLLDFTISSTGFDLSALFGTSVNTSSINNQRGETLYKTAVSRCKANVLSTCTAQGVDASVITNSYDLEIDKQCIAYERSLSDSNDQMTATVRNAKTVLQKARLMVAQQRNQYDLRACVSALDACMQDDFVCGTDYEDCLDPSGQYIIDGKIVVGSMPGKPITASDTSAANSVGMHKDGLYKTWMAGDKYAWNYGDNTSGDLSDYINKTLYGTSNNSGYPEATSTNMSKFLQFKIGYHNNSDGKNYGMCMSVLNKCQDYTYDTKKRSYKPDNQVISEYLYRTLIQIKAAQDKVLSDYAENCISDVTTCLGSNNYTAVTEGMDSNQTTAAQNSQKIAINACKSVIVTCMSVNGNVLAEPTPAKMAEWATDVYNGTVLSLGNY